MIDAFRLALPIGLAAYCIYQAVRRPIFLLGMPFLHVMRVSVFFDAIRPLSLPGAWGGTNGAVLLWIVLAWAWCAYQSTIKTDLTGTSGVWRPARRLPEEYLLVALGVLVFAKLVWGGFGPADTRTLLSQFAPWGLLLVGFWLVRGVVRRSSSDDVAAFMLFVAVATGIASVLFILHQGLRIPVYHVTEYLVFSFEGKTLSRTYWFMSPFLLVPLAVGFARRSWSLGGIALVVVTMVAVVVSYTRNYLLAAAAVVMVLLALRSLKEGRPALFLRNLSAVGAVLAFVVVIMLVALPTPTGFFLSRMESLTHTSTVVEDQNLLVRYSDLRTVTSNLSQRGLLLVGAPFGVADGMSQEVRHSTADSTWTGTVFWTGLIGAALVVSLFFLFGLRAFRLFMSSDKTAEFLGAVFFALIIAMFIMSLTNWTFLDPNTCAMGFWLFAFIAGATKTLSSGKSIASASVASRSSR